MPEVTFKRGDRVVHHKGNPYIILGISNKKSDKKGFVPTVIYRPEGNDENDADNWYSRPLSEFVQKFNHAKPQERLVRRDDGTVEVVLGAFNSPNSRGDIYVSDIESVEKFLQSRIGKCVGEMNFPNPQDGGDLIERLKRITTVESKNSSGLLADYEIIQHGNKDERGNRPFTVIGFVEPSRKLLMQLEGGIVPSFGIRCITKPKLKEMGKPSVSVVDALVSFDIAAVCPRV